MVKILFNLLFGVILILVWLKFVDVKQIVNTISGLNPKSLIWVFIFLLLSPIIRAIRLKVFLSEIKKIPLKDLIFLSGVAVMLNFFIPIRAGEIAKGVYLSSNYGLKFGKSIIWVFLDRFVDFMVVLLMSVILLVVIPTALNITFIMIITVIFIAALGLSYFAIFKIGFAKKLINFLSHLLIFNSIKRYFDSFSHFILDSFLILRRHPKDLSLMIILTVLAYGADAAIWYFTFVALNAPQDFLKMYLGQLLSALTYLIPSAPGYVGSAEASGLLILSGVFSMETNLASAMIVLSHILIAIFVPAFGLISVFSLKVDLGVILRKALKKGD
ncbi:flippase-like domain-containing protein [Candidatus Daviesbacteria bacterium]|nr:flippase-like domain-containing protein [Candidatus Daviesbacteria bacterium]